jgi:hypothetical protein
MFNIIKGFTKMLVQILWKEIPMAKIISKKTESDLTNDGFNECKESDKAVVNALVAANIEKASDYEFLVIEASPVCIYWKGKWY